MNVYKNEAGGRTVPVYGVLELPYESWTSALPPIVGDVIVIGDSAASIAKNVITEAFPSVVSNEIITHAVHI